MRDLTPQTIESALDAAFTATFGAGWNMQARTPDPKKVLTDSETFRRVLSLLNAGQSTSYVAAALGLNPEIVSRIALRNHKAKRSSHNGD